MADYQSRAIEGRNDIGHGEGFARAGDAQKRAVILAGPEALYHGLDGLGLIAGRLHVGD